MKTGTMYKRVLKDSQYFNFLTNYPNFRLGALLTSVFCTFIIVISTFTQLKLGYLPYNTILNMNLLFENINNFGNLMNLYYYIPQVPAVLLAGALLGPRIGIFSILIYIIAGLLGVPIFASGGGLHYYTDLGFGYILGYIPCAYIVGHIMAGKINTYSLIKASILGSLTIHIVGILYMLILLSLQNNSIIVISEWIWVKSIIQLPYDFLIGFTVVSLARPIRGLLWAAMD